MEPSEACELCAFPKTAREQEERIALLRARLAALEEAAKAYLSAKDRLSAVAHAEPNDDDWDSASAVVEEADKALRAALGEGK